MLAAVLGMSARGAAIVGAAGSLVLLLRAGERTPPLLLVLFVGWVVSPFAGLALASVLSKRWSAPTRTAIHWVMIIVALGSIVAYGAEATGLTGARTAAVFLLVPAASWVAAVLAVATTAARSRRESRRDS